jgi:Uma2 family endonuclease
MAIDLLPLTDTDGGVVLLRPDTDLDELFALIDAQLHWRCDVCGDRLIWMPPANPWSSNLAAELAIELTTRVREVPGADVRPFGADAGFRIADEPKPHGRIVSPDFALIRASRITPRTAPRRGFWALVPDLAVEVRSPSDRQEVWQEKLDVYADVAGITLWAIDRAARTVLVYRDGHKTELRADDERLHVPESLTQSTPPVSISLAEIWSLV